MICDVPPLYCEEFFQEASFKHEASVFDLAWEHILKIEGSTVTDIPGDRGGLSKFGITKHAYADFLKKKSVSSETIKNLTAEQAKTFYLRVYWQGMSIEQIKSKAVAIAILNQHVHRGPYGGAAFTQKFLNELSGRKVVAVSAIMGQDTVDAINAVDPVDFLLEYFKASQRSYSNITKNNPGQQKFLRGWLERSFELLMLLKTELKEGDNNAS